MPRAPVFSPASPIQWYWLEWLPWAFVMGSSQEGYSLNTIHLSIWHPERSTRETPNVSNTTWGLFLPRACLAGFCLILQKPITSFFFLFASQSQSSTETSRLDRLSTALPSAPFSSTWATICSTFISPFAILFLRGPQNYSIQCGHWVKINESNPCAT